MAVDHPVHRHSHFWTAYGMMLLDLKHLAPILVTRYYSCMTSKTKLDPGTNTRMAILGTLSFQPMYGYEIRRDLELRRVDRWAGVSYGSVYGRLRTLAAEGLIEVSDSGPVGNRPSRTVYQITPEGTAELARILRAALSTPQLPHQPVDLALSFSVTAAARLGADELERLLAEREERLSSIAAELEDARTEPTSVEPGVAELVSDLIDHSQRQVETEREWIAHIAHRLASGAYHTPLRGALELGAESEENTP